MDKLGLKKDVSTMCLEEVMFYVGNVSVSRANFGDN